MKYLWITFAVLGLTGLFYLNFRAGQDGPASEGGYLYGMHDGPSEASYCLAVLERIRDITHGLSEPKLERFISAQLPFWRKRANYSTTAGRPALARDIGVDGVNAGAFLHEAIQRCSHRAVRFYGAELPALQ